MKKEKNGKESEDIWKKIISDVKAVCIQKNNFFRVSSTCVIKEELVEIESTCPDIVVQRG